ncbi:hypothetical protein RJ640_010933 [Escallonia rubra]|uniref:AMP-activated protein kinase glycogen-binding domain-containing protein n=1 Tax=Escallonia rubra TaxID=112253 RepID=A0AA88RJR7_9ASTE|nr:hypothetical protein RJ640_010933 [Escallonia rubra]
MASGWWRRRRTLNHEKIHRIQCNMSAWSSRMGSQRFSYSSQVSIGTNFTHHSFWRTFSTPVSIEEKLSALQSESHSNKEEYALEASPDESLAHPMNSEVLKSVLADSERTKLVKKLSEANQQNRFLKRQLQVKEDALVDFKRELATMELEIQALVALAEEIAISGIPKGSRKLNGKYIQYYLRSRLEAVQEKLKEQIKDVDAAQSKEVSLFWCGMAESVQVMGSFDGWSQGEHLSAEYTSSYTKFSTTLMLRPGRYEIKFMVDGEWRVSPELPTVGEGLMKNNLLIVS